MKHAEAIKQMKAWIEEVRGTPSEGLARAEHDRLITPAGCWDHQQKVIDRYTEIIVKLRDELHRRMSVDEWKRFNQSPYYGEDDTRAEIDALEA